MPPRRGSRSAPSGWTWCPRIRLLAVAERIGAHAIESGFDGSRGPYPITVDVPAGSMLLLSSLTLHRSPPNTSPAGRRALLLSFQPAARPRQIELAWRPERVHELP